MNQVSLKFSELKDGHEVHAFEYTKAKSDKANGDKKDKFFPPDFRVTRWWIWKSKDLCVREEILSSYRNRSITFSAMIKTCNPLCCNLLESDHCREMSINTGVKGPKTALKTEVYLGMYLGIYQVYTKKSFEKNS